jgi:hypothetical protein
MARKFVSASNQTASAAFPSIAYPYTVAHWFNITTLSGSNQSMFGLYPSGSTTLNNVGTAINGAANKAQIFVSDSGGSFDAIDIGSALSAGTWHHIAHAGILDNSRIGYLDGSGTPTSVARALGTQNTFQIGGFEGGAGNLDGLIAELAIWNVALTQGEVSALAAGVQAYRVRRSSLVGYWPFFGLTSPEPDLSGGARNITLANSPAKANHAPTTLWTPKRPSFGSLPAPSATFDMTSRRLAGTQQQQPDTPSHTFTRSGITPGGIIIPNIGSVFILP